MKSLIHSIFAVSVLAVALPANPSLSVATLALPGTDPPGLTIQKGNVLVSTTLVLSSISNGSFSLKVPIDGSTFAFEPDTQASRICVSTDDLSCIFRSTEQHSPPSNLLGSERCVDIDPRSYLATGSCRTDRPTATVYEIDKRDTAPVDVFSIQYFSAADVYSFEIKAYASNSVFYTGATWAVDRICVTAPEGICEFFDYVKGLKVLVGPVPSGQSGACSEVGPPFTPPYGTCCLIRDSPDCPF